jgi:hypothetical protein
MVRIITPEEYDAAVLREPNSCPLFAMGDRRSGSQLLADAYADAGQTVAQLASTANGRAQLESIAAAAEALIAGCI